LPGYVSDSESMYTQSAATICRNSGGIIRSVHTPYGDITMCAFPDGRTEHAQYHVDIDLNQANIVKL